MTGLHAIPLQLCLAYMLLPAEIVLIDAPMGACAILCLCRELFAQICVGVCILPPLLTLDLYLVSCHAAVTC